MTGNEDRQWLERVRSVLDDGAEAIDPATRARLAAARRAALARARRRRTAATMLPWAAAGAALAGWLALSAWLPAPAPGRAAWTPTLAEIGDEPPDLIEDLEFYAWLAAGDPGGGDGGHG